MQRHAERRQAKLLVQAELFEAKEVFANVFGEIAANELFTFVVEGTDAICANGCRVKSRTL